MIYQVTHTTTYEYSEPVTLCQNLAHLTPRSSSRQWCQPTRLAIIPNPKVIASRTDYFGNREVFFSVQEPHRQLSITARHTAEVLSFVAPDPAQTPPWEEVRDLLARDRSPSVLEAYEFVFDSPYVQVSAELGEYAGASFGAGRPLLEAILDLTRRIHADFRYDAKATTVATPLQRVFGDRRGVCQDFAHLEVACLRSLGLAARYVSGYLCTKPPAGRERLTGADASHAWVSVYCGDTGWIDLDPTNNQIPSDQHIVLAWGRDYHDVSPIKGVILGGGSHTVTVAVDVVPTETPT